MSVRYDEFMREQHVLPSYPEEDDPIKLEIELVPSKDSSLGKLNYSFYGKNGELLMSGYGDTVLDCMSEAYLDYIHTLPREDDDKLAIEAMQKARMGMIMFGDRGRRWG